MTGETATEQTTALTGPELLSAIADILREVTGSDAEWAARIAPESALEGDLGLESLELVAVSERLRAAYDVDLAAYVAELDIDQLIELTVADLVDYVVATR